MTKPNVKFTRKQLVLLIVVAACLLLFGILTLVSAAFSNTQKTQHNAKEWDEDGRYAMISAFIREDEGLTENQIAQLEYVLDQALAAESMEAPAENARLFVSAYSRCTEVSLSTERAGYQSCTAYGVGGDFFRFHNYRLLSGNYLVEDNIMKDFVVLDKEAAWKLFGSIEVDGMQVTYGGRTYTVAGIVEPADGYLYEAGGAVGGTVFFPISALADGGADSTVTCYEIIFPNPVTGFAQKKVTDALKQVGVDENKVKIVNNSERYSLISSLKRVRTWTHRGMSFQELKYPYWENSAIGVENIVDLITVLRIIFIVPPVLIILISIIRFHPIHRFKLLILKLIDKIRK